MQLQRSLSDLAIGVNSEAFPTTCAVFVRRYNPFGDLRTVQLENWIVE